MRDSRSREGELRVRVIRGRNLAIRDLRSSDPYVILRSKNKRVKTKVIKKNVNPLWNEDLTLGVQDSNDNIKLEVFDKDTFTFDDPMGNAEIDIKPLVAAGREELGTLMNNDIIRIVSPDLTNNLVGESKIYIFNGKLFQDMTLRLKNVECGEVDLRLEWVDATKDQ